MLAIICQGRNSILGSMPKKGKRGVGGGGGVRRIYAFFLRDDRKALRAQIFETQNYANAYKAQKLKVIYQL
jgi:hypothetical protein